MCVDSCHVMRHDPLAVSFRVAVRENKFYFLLDTNHLIRIICIPLRDRGDEL